MGLKTNELQQLAAVLGTDSLLAETAAAGTGRVSIAQLAEFLANGDGAVKAALLNKAEAGLVTHEKAVSTEVEEDAYLQDILFGMVGHSVTHIISSHINSFGQFRPYVHHITLYKTSNSYASLIGMCYGKDGMSLLTRSIYDDKWGPWEWVNPRLDIGVEYRTVERYLGKPVYCKAINCGAFSGNKYVSSGIDYAKCAIVRCHGIIDSGSGMFPIAFFPNTATTPPAGICFTLSRAGGSYEIKIFDTGNAEGAITVTLYYTKIDD